MAAATLDPSSRCRSSSTAASPLEGGRRPDLTIDCDDGSTSSSDSCAGPQPPPPSTPPPLPPTPSGQPATPSSGSALHGTGGCRPCAWFWKPQGCVHGQACHFCHECPEGEIRLRKAAKGVMRRTPQGVPATPRCLPAAAPARPGAGPPEPGPRLLAQAAPAAARPLPPPAPPLLPPGPAAGERPAPPPPAREAMPTTAGQAGLPAPPPPPPHQPALERDLVLATIARQGEPLPPPRHSPAVAVALATVPWQPPPPAAACPPPPPGLRAPPGLEAAAARPRPPAPAPAPASALPCLLTSRPAAVRPVASGAQAKLILSTPSPLAVPLLGTPTASPPSKVGGGALCRATSIAGYVSCDAEQPVVRALPDRCGTGVLSRGSLGHGNGMCEPCAWFWKPQGCANGRTCNRCHLCPEGEVKARKKAKKLALRTPDDQVQTTPSTQPTISPQA